MFNEDNTTEQMIISTLIKNGWEYIQADQLGRDESDVMVEDMVRNALIRLNPEIAEDESRSSVIDVLGINGIVKSRELGDHQKDPPDHKQRVTQRQPFRQLRHPAFISVHVLHVVSH